MRKLVVLLDQMSIKPEEREARRPSEERRTTRPNCGTLVEGALNCIKRINEKFWAKLVTWLWTGYWVSDEDLRQSNDPDDHAGNCNH